MTTQDILIRESNEEDHMAFRRFNAGGKKQKEFTEEQKQEIKVRILCGCSTERFIHGTVGDQTKDLEDHITARAMMQARINEYGGEDLPLPKKTNSSNGKPQRHQTSSPMEAPRIKRKQFGG